LEINQAGDSSYWNSSIIINTELIKLSNLDNISVL
jgi:hypothetical protein